MLVSLSLALNRSNIELLFETYKSSAAVLVTGVVELVLGTAMVVGHNVWAFDFRVVITLIGWVLLARGVGRTLFPSRTVSMLASLRKMQPTLVLPLIVAFLVGAYLSYSGFVSTPF